MAGAEPVGGIDDQKVCVVAAGTAWPFYRMTGAYVCQENRYFQEDTGRLAFYSNRLVHGVAPRILHIEPSLDYNDAFAATLALSSHALGRQLGTVLAAALEQGHTDAAVQIVLLSSIDSEETETFEPVRHDGASAWTQRQRYTTLQRLRSANSTDDLVDGGGS